ncbi:MAG: cytochrome c biogenesis protein CcsA [Planctomycetaceae bacterium]|nr:cytochrome c biogenesis protein CcsA [Planctomycetaceae bacterium]
MRRFGGLLLGLGLALAIGRSASAATDPKALGVGPAYEELGKLAVMHAGRIKPLDTLAREEVKQIFGRETIKLRDESNGVVATWGPVAAMFDWSVRPEFWDDQPIILVEYVPLKRLLLAETIQARLAAAAEKGGTSPEDRAALKALADDPEVSQAKLTRFLERARIADEDSKAIKELAAKLGEAHRWLTPRELENARVVSGGQRLPFDSWFRDLDDRKRQADSNVEGVERLAEVENRAIEVGRRLVHYQAIRDREIRSVEPMLVMPRPSTPAFLAFSAAALRKGREQGPEALTPLQLEAANSLAKYWNDIPLKDREMPGTDAEFDKRFTGWLKDKAGWIPFKVLLDAKPEELAEAGYPARPIEAFRAAFKAMEQAESAAPGEAPAAKASTLLAASRELGEAVNPGMYPTLREMEREVYFNQTNPFWKAPVAYGAALALLAISLGFLATARRSALWWVGRSAYTLGMIALGAGIALEVFGFTMRVRISGWAPVTNMYETVIWVSLVAAVLALVFELIFRGTYAALAGSGVALLGTVLAANVPLLDPSIHNLNPVLRSNYWLTIHVLTEVSSYAAFALAMGLGVIASLYYLTATYRRSPSFSELAAWLAPGLPLLAVGVIGLGAGSGWLGPRHEIGPTLYYVSLALAYVGEFLTIVGVSSVVGESVARASLREDAHLDEAAIAGEAAVPAATAVQTVTVDEEQGAVATLSRPTVAEIRSRAARNRPKLDARGLAMQETAAKIKPLSNFIYRTMQVGVLLIAAGTILGGVWADYSWGRFWGWDPKEVWALITLLVYLIPLHGRFAGWVNTFGLVVSSVFCFLSVVMAWYGVNFVLGVGLHSYGFTEGGGQWTVTGVVLAVLALTAAAAWRRYLGSRVTAPTA